MKRILPAICLLLSGALLARGANFVMSSTDAINTTSFNTGLNWTGGAAPAIGNTYQTAAFLLRTPANATSVAFAGDSLEIQSGGELRLKTGATVTITNLIVANTAIVDLTAPTGGNAGALAGHMTLNGTAVLRSGIQASENVDALTISSLLSGTGGFTTTGSFGTIILTAANTYTGSTVVNGGSVLMNGVQAGPVSVSSGTLGGNGTIKGAVTNLAGILQPGIGGLDTSTLTISNNLVLAGTLVMSLNRTNVQKAAKLAGLTTLNQGGTLIVTNVGPTLQLGDSFSLFSAASYTGNFTTINLPVLSSGLGWRAQPGCKWQSHGGHYHGAGDRPLDQ